MKPSPVTPAQAKDMLDRGERVVFIDARNPVAWGSSKVKLPAAIRMPVDAVSEQAGEIPANGTAITYCT